MAARHGGAAHLDVAAPSFKIANDELLRDGKPIQIRSGSLHYSRVPHEYWPDRLQRMRALGLDAAATKLDLTYDEVQGAYVLRQTIRQ